MPHNFYKTKSEITAWLNSMGVSNYMLMPSAKYGFMVNVTDNVDLSSKNLTSIPVKFNIIKGDFNCSRNKLTTLNGSPHKCDYFGCHDNQLTSLKSSPLIIKSHFFASLNNITSMKGITPNIPGGILDLSMNKINTLEFIPQSVGYSIYLGENPHSALPPTSLMRITYNELYELHVIEMTKKLLDANLKINSSNPSKITISKL